jgi:predicted NBD/HSP70 family sugar kinase
MRTDTHRARVQRQQGAVAVLRYVHANPGATRADVTHALGLSSGSTADIVARMKRLRVLTETDAPPSGERGRPSPRLVPHTYGPLVCAVDISHERWQVALTELGGNVVDEMSGPHTSRRPADMLGELRDPIEAAHRRHPRRLGAVSVAVAGTVRGTEIVEASGLRWRDVSLEMLRPRPDLPLLVTNDATLAGVAEARRGAGRQARVVLHLLVAVGVGGVLVVDGNPVDGATGAGGEFGHLPFADPSQSCPCGAYGCWDLEVGGRAMARVLGQRAPRNPRTRAEQLIARASTDPAARAAVESTARALGRGIGGLVNALDPELVTLSGLAADLTRVAPATLNSAYRRALMRFHRAQAPPLMPSTLEPNSQLTGATDIGFDALLTPDGIETWTRRAA